MEALTREQLILLRELVFWHFMRQLPQEFAAGLWEPKFPELTLAELAPLYEQLVRLTDRPQPRPC